MEAGTLAAGALAPLVFCGPARARAAASPGSPRPRGVSGRLWRGLPFFALPLRALRRPLRWPGERLSTLGRSTGSRDARAHRDHGRAPARGTCDAARLRESRVRRHDLAGVEPRSLAVSPDPKSA